MTTTKPCGDRFIAILVPIMGLGGGAERVCMNLAHEFLERGYAVDLLVMTTRGESLSYLSDRIRVVDFEAQRLRGVFWPLSKYLRERRPAALLAAMWPITCIAVVAAILMREGARIVLSDHTALSQAARSMGGLRRWFMKLSIRLLYPYAQGIVGVSKGVSEDLAQFTGLPLSLITTIYNPAARGALPALLSPDDTVGGWRKDGFKRIITVGRLKSEKDHRSLIIAFAKLREQVPARLLIIGEGPLQPELEELVRELNLCDAVFLHGFAEDPYPYYLAADLFVLSSVQEGFGNVVVEAMECGLPVVCTDCLAGPSEILDGGRYGRLVPVGDIDALVTAMAETLVETSDVQRQRLRASEFSIARATDAYLELLDPGFRKRL